MRLTIGIPVRNGEKFLRSALESAVKQTRKADEILVLDDASTDDSAEIAQAGCWGGSVRYVHNATSDGFVSAFNRIAQLATGDFVVILSHDDLLDADYLRHAEAGLQKFSGAKHLYCGYKYIDEAGTLIRESPRPHSLEAFLLSGKEYSQRYLRGVSAGRHIHRLLGVATNRELMLDCPFRAEIGLIVDDDLFVRLGQFTDVVGISRPLVSIRIHSDSTSARLQSLSLQLAKDYVFLSENYTHNRRHLDLCDLALYYSLAIRFMDESLLEGFRMGNPEQIARVVNLRREFSAFAATASHNLRSPISSILWRVASWHAFIRPIVAGATFLSRARAMGRKLLP